MDNRFSASPAGAGALRTKIADLTAAAFEREGEGDPEGALSLRLKAAMFAQELDDPISLGETMVECSRAFVGVGEFVEALRYLEHARDLALREGGDTLKGEVYRGYGALYKARAQFDQAAVCFDRALERLEFSSRHASALQALVDLSEIYLGGGRTAEAGALLARARMLPPASDPALVVRLELNAGRLLLLGGDRAGAVAAYELAGRAAERARRPHEREVVAIGLAGLYGQEGRLAEAAAKLREALALSIVAYARESARPLERARLAIMLQRLSEVDVALDSSGASPDTRRQVDEAVKLYNTHPLVLTGALAPYGTVSADIQGPERAERVPDITNVRAEIAPRSDPPNPK